MGVAEGAVESIGRTMGKRESFVNHLPGRSSMAETRQRVAAEWRRRGEEGLRSLGEKLTQGGLKGEMEKAITLGELSEEVQQAVNAMRVVSGKDGEGLRQWLGEIGLTESDTEVVQQSVEAIGDREAVVTAMANLAEVVGGKLEEFPGGSDVERSVWQMAGSLKSRAEPPGGSEWGDIGMGGTTSSPAPVGEPEPPDKDRKRPDKPKVTLPPPPKRPVGPRKQPLGTWARAAFVAGMLACCASATALGLWGSKLAESAAPKEEQVPGEFAGVGGNWQSARFLADYMFYSPGEEGEFPDSGHTAIDSFLKAYGLADSNKEKRAYGEAMLEELEKQGLSYSEGIGPWQNIVGFDEVGLSQRLIEQGYSHEDIGDLINWLKEYLTLRDDWKNQTGYQPTFDDRLARSGGLRNRRSWIRSVARYRQYKG